MHFEATVNGLAYSVKLRRYADQQNRWLFYAGLYELLPSEIFVFFFLC